MLENFRHFVGMALKQPGLREFFRRIYLAHSQRYVTSRSSYLSGAWVRRSVLTEDFVPAMSDLDLTLLISLKNLEKLYENSVFRKTLLIRDIQIVAEEFFTPWLNTGGFRNRQFKQWRKLLSSPELTEISSTGAAELAFESGHECYQIYIQLERLMKKTSPMAGEVKLWKEIERLKVFWQTGREEITTASRKRFDISHDRALLLSSLEEFAGVLHSKIIPPMNQFDINPLIRKNDVYGDWLHLKIMGKEVFLLRDPLEFRKVKDVGGFIITENFLKLIKGIGVQEQTLLNQAGNTSGYYREFNRQRLAHDLVQALLLQPENKSQIFFCFKNIEDFIPAIREQEEEVKELPSKSEDLIKLATRYLALLASAP